MVIQVYIDEERLIEKIRQKINELPHEFTDIEGQGLQSRILLLFPQLVQAYIGEDLDILVQKAVDAIVSQYICRTSYA